MNHPDGSTADTADIEFGFPQFWPAVYKQFEQQFESIGGLIRLADEIVLAVEKGATEPVNNVICALTRATVGGACEAVVLCGNGCGVGAVKIVRGMYESRWTAEYLRRHPEEVADYLEFSKTLLWRRLQWLQEKRPGQASRIPQDELNKAKDDYSRVRFTDDNGRVRSQWSRKTVREIARDIGRETEYELPYAIACSFHHSNFEGLTAHFTLEGSSMEPDPPPSIRWVRQALSAVHTNVWFALCTLNDSSSLDFNQQLDAAQQDLLKVWKE